MLDSLVSSKTKIKLLLKFFLNSSNTAYLRNLEAEFGESTNSIRLELNKFEESGLLNSYSESNKKIFKANTKHPLYPEINSIIRKYVGIDRIIDSIVSKLGEPDHVWLVGNLARGLNSDTIELKISGNVDKDYLEELVQKAEKTINKKLKIELLSEVESLVGSNKLEPSLLLWSKA